MKLQQIAMDVGIAAGLLVALGLVFVLDPRKAEGPTGPMLEYTVHQGGATKERKPLKMAVSLPIKWDNMGQKLTELGKGFEHVHIQAPDIMNPERVKEYDVLFLTCSNATQENLHVLAQALRNYVEQGGTLYASDLRFGVVGEAFRDYLGPALNAGAGKQTVTGNIVDPGLKQMLKATEVRLNFDQGGWQPAAFDRNKVTVYLEGEYQPTAGVRRLAPLMVSFPCGKGAVIFTSFHNSKQDDPQFKELLKYVVFRTVTAKEEGQAIQNILASGLKPAQSSLISVNANNPKVESKFNNPRPGKLQFTLSFNSTPGVALELTVRAPGTGTERKVATHKGEGTFTIEVPNAAAGEWDIIVTALGELPENFPFNVLVAEPAKQ